MIKRKWTANEESLLEGLINAQTGPYNWEYVSNKLKGLGVNKTIKQIKSRWYNNLLPGLNKESWTIEESLQLLDKYQYIGNRWKQIASEFPGRTYNNVKNQFFCFIRKALRLAFKDVSKEMKTSSTKLIKVLTPKTLSKLLSETIEIDSDDKQKKLKVNMMEFIKKYGKLNNLKMKFKPSKEDQKIAMVCLEMINNIERSYLNNKNSKRICKPKKTEESKDNCKDKILYEDNFGKKNKEYKNPTDQYKVRKKSVDSSFKRGKKALLNKKNNAFFAHFKHTLNLKYKNDKTPIKNQFLFQYDFLNQLSLTFNECINLITRKVTNQEHEDQQLKSKINNALDSMAFVCCGIAEKLRICDINKKTDLIELLNFIQTVDLGDKSSKNVDYFYNNNSQDNSSVNLDSDKEELDIETQPRAKMSNYEDMWKEANGMDHNKFGFQDYIESMDIQLDQSFDDDFLHRPLSDISGYIDRPGMNDSIYDISSKIEETNSLSR